MKLRARWIRLLAAAPSAFAISMLTPSMACAQITVAEQEVLATDDRRTEALRRGDTAPLREIYLDDYTLVTPAGIVRSKAEQIGELESGELRYRSIEVLERTVRVYGDVAVVISRDKYHILLRGQEPGGDLRFTRIYKKFGDAWRLIATHGSPVAQ